MKLAKEIVFWTLLILFIALSLFFGYKYYYKNYYIPTHTTTITKFSTADLKDEKIYYKASKEYIISLLGQPLSDSNSIGNELNQDNAINRIFYDDYNFCFYNNALFELSSSSPDFSFKGIKIGDDEEKVLNTFYRDDSNDSDVFSSDESIIGKYIYGNFNINNLETVKTKDSIFYAYKTLENIDEHFIIYAYMCPPYINEYASAEDNITLLSFEIENNRVKSISWRVGNANL